MATKVKQNKNSVVYFKIFNQDKLREDTGSQENVFQ